MKTEVNLPFTLNFPVPTIIVCSVGVSTNLTLTATLRRVHTRSQRRGRERPSSLKHFTPVLMRSRLMMNKISYQSLCERKRTVLNCRHEEALHFAVASQADSATSTVASTELISVDHSLLAKPALPSGGPGILVLCELVGLYKACACAHCFGNSGEN